MIKRLFDITASFFGLLFLSPVFLVIALVLKLKMPGPVFFCQQRTGRNGNPFTIYKFRSMTIDHGGSTTSIKGESRITPFGAKLRKYKLDELPELWNLLIGDMSLVGPRPDTCEYTDRLQGKERVILELRPGITGPASLKYANEEELLANVPDPHKYIDEIIWPDKVKINMEYYHKQSFFGDIFVILRTVFGRGRSNK